MTFSVTHMQPRDRDGNPGMSEMYGDHPTLAEAQAHAETLVQAKGRLWWKRFSDTTWGLMDGGVYTSVFVSDLSAYRTTSGGAA